MFFFVELFFCFYFICFVLFDSYFNVIYNTVKYPKDYFNSDWHFVCTIVHPDILKLYIMNNHITNKFTENGHSFPSNMYHSDHRDSPRPSSLIIFLVLALLDLWKQDTVMIYQHIPTSRLTAGTLHVGPHLNSSLAWLHNLHIAFLAVTE